MKRKQKKWGKLLMQINNPVSSVELTETSPPLYRRVSLHNPPTVTWLEDVSCGMLLGYSPCFADTQHLSRDINT